MAEGDEKVHPAKGAGGFLKKYKYPIIGVGIVAVILVFMSLRKSSGGSQTSSTGTGAAGMTPGLEALNGIDPATGIPYAEEYGLNNTGGYSSGNGYGGYLSDQINALSQQISTLSASENANTGSTTGTPNSGKASYGTVTLGGAPGLPNSGIWSTNVAVGSTPDQAYAGAGTIPYGTYALAGPPVSGKGGYYYPVVGPGGATDYALGENVQNYKAAA